MPCEKHGPRASVTTKTSACGLGFCLLSPSGHVFHTAWETMIKSYINLWHLFTEPLPDDYLRICQFGAEASLLVNEETDIINTLRPKQNGRHYADDIFKCIFLNENVWIPIEISLKFVPKGPINNIPALVQIMAWRRSGDKPLSETMMVSLLTHICVTRPQWVKDE